MTKGTATIDFGAFPGKSDASVAVTGQTGIVAGSLVDAWIRPAATADHTADEHLVETLSIFAGNIIAGTGFTIYGLNNNTLFEYPFGAREGLSRGGQVGRGTRIYGQWTIAWVWD